MPVAIWPPAMPQTHLRDGFSLSPHEPALHTDMEQGAARKRPRYGNSPGAVSLAWRMAADQFRLFAGFYHFGLNEGSDWVVLPVWTGDGYEAIEVQFKDRYQVAPRAALAVTVTAQVILRGLDIPLPDEAELASYRDETGALIWPAALPQTPLRAPATLDPHQPVQITDIDEGPKDKHAFFPNSPGQIAQSWVMTPAQAALFKRFYKYGLSNGIAWFKVPAWTGSLETVWVRFVDCWTLTPHGATGAAISGDFTIRKMPMLDDGLTLVWGLLGSDGLEAFGNGIHIFVHETYPEATI